jgi:hypothetical protein
MIQQNTLIKLIKKGFGWYKISKQCNCSISTVRYWMEKYKLKTLKRKEKKKILDIPSNCIYCNKIINNDNSKRNHERLCKSNPQYKKNSSFLSKRVLKKDFISWQKKPEYKKLYKVWLIKIKKIHKNKAIRLKMAETFKRNRLLSGKTYKVKKEVKEKLSLIRSRIIEEKGKGGFSDIKYYKIKNIAGEKYIVRGTWELNYAKYLNDRNIIWKRKIYLYYYDKNNIKRYYSPDFYIPKNKKYIEIKGYFSEKDKIKIYRVEKQNKIKIKIIQKKELDKILSKWYHIKSNI